MAERSRGSTFGALVREAAVMRQRLTIVATTVPRALLGWFRASRRGPGSLPPPAQRSVRQAGEVGVDELFLAANALVQPVPHRGTLRAAIDDTARLVDALGGREPLELHPEPAPLLDPYVKRAWSYGTRIERVEFPSECHLPPEVARRAPWLGAPQCATAHAVVLRHSGRPRPWVVCVHGAGQGRSSDLVAFRARHLHRDLGLNVALPVLPLHGRRLVRGARVPGFDFPANVAALLQGVHDIRRLLSWVIAQDAPHVAVYGVSLGAYTASAVAGVEPAVGTVVAGIPVSRLSQLLAYHLERFGGPRARVMGPLMRSEPLEALGALVDPLALPVMPSPQRRFVFAGLGDAVTTPEQALDLWEHWGRPRIEWYPGGHVGHVWSKEVHRFVDEILSGLPEGMDLPPTRRERAA